MKKLIRVGEPRRGLFVEKDGPNASIQVNKTISYGLWHHRMGHPLNHALSKVSSSIQLYTSINNKDDFYGVCLYPRQTRVPFSISKNKVLKCSDLIHCDT